jgi:hypothetical protein
VIDPAVADQATAVFAVPVTVAENCAVAESATIVFDGLTVTETVAGGGGGDGGGGGADPTVMFTGWLVEAPLPGFVTVTGNLPVAGRFPVAFIEVGLPYIAAHETPFTCTMELSWKFAPFRLMVWFDPVGRLLGYVDHTTGIGCTTFTVAEPETPDGVLAAFTATTLLDGTLAGAL